MLMTYVLMSLHCTSMLTTQNIMSLTLILQMASLALVPELHLTADDERAALKELYLCINCIVRYTVTQAESGGRSSSAVFRMVNVFYNH